MTYQPFVASIPFVHIESGVLANHLVFSTVATPDARTLDAEFVDTIHYNVPEKYLYVDPETSLFYLSTQAEGYIITEYGEIDNSGPGEWRGEDWLIGYEGLVYYRHAIPVQHRIVTEDSDGDSVEYGDDYFHAIFTPINNAYLRIVDDTVMVSTGMYWDGSPSPRGRGRFVVDSPVDSPPESVEEKVGTLDLVDLCKDPDCESCQETRLRHGYARINDEDDEEVLIEDMAREGMADKPKTDLDWLIEASKESE